MTVQGSEPGPNLLASGAINDMVQYVQKVPNLTQPTFEQKKEMNRLAGTLQTLPPELTEEALGELFSKQQPSLPEQTVLDIALYKTPSLCRDRTITNGVFSYYGKDIELSDEMHDFSRAIEINAGILGIEDSKGTIVGFIDIHPDYPRKEGDKINAQIHSLNDFFPQALGKPIAEATQTDIGVFIKESSDLLKGEFPDVNSGALPLEGKYHLWKLLKNPQYSNAVTILRTEFEEDSLLILQSLNGSPELILKLADQVEKLLLASDEPKTSVKANNALAGIKQLLTQLGRADLFIGETGAAITPTTLRSKSEEILKRSVFVSDKLRAIAQEYVGSLPSSFDLSAIQESSQFHTQATLALQTQLTYLNNHFKGVENEKHKFSLEELDSIWKGYTQNPSSHESFNLLMSQWLTYALVNQQEITPEERNKWLYDFYRHVISIDVYHENAKAYTDRDTVITMLTNGLRSMSEALGISDYNLASLGCGDMSIEKSLLDLLPPEAKPKEIIGVDMMEQTLIPEGLQYIQSDLLRFAREPENKGTHDVAIAIGSPLNNMNLLAVQLQYMVAAAKILKKNGVFVSETGSPLPVPDINTRRKRMEEFLALYPEKPTGSLAINHTYRRQTDKPDEIGAFIYTHPLMLMFARLSGFKMIQPSEDPVVMRQYEEALQDPSSFQQMTQQHPDGWKMPFWMAGADAHKPEDPVNARVFYWLQKTGEPNNALLEIILTHFFHPSLQVDQNPI